MSEGKPELVAINHDDYHAQHVGIAQEGLQFFLTTRFEPGGCEYIHSNQNVNDKSVMQNQRNIWKFVLTI